ncbi:hypothetical protein ANANG_G00242900 [Anguilla anguilla]|uniref:PHD-type domain-containing protein n=1 Tax=Anguilla anguilla TaxID=7936 RepID=A0A9D3LUC7_ANGAN|nr:hypothetical protein ANANG_G00242900 [Anguilla anguilla]
MRRLIDQGVGLAPHPSVERAMARLQELLTVSEHWEDRARDLLKARPRLSVETLAAALQEAESIPAYLPTCLLLRDAVTKAQEWLQEAESLQLSPLPRLEALVSEVQAWRESAARTFLKKNAPDSLLEVGTGAQKAKPKKAKDAVAGGKRKGGKLVSLSDVERALCESKDSASAMATLAEVRLKEMEAMLSLRTANEAKLALAAGGVACGVCVCQGAPAGAMRQCELCRDAFHRGCVAEAAGAEPRPDAGRPGCARAAGAPSARRWTGSSPAGLAAAAAGAPAGGRRPALPDRAHGALAAAAAAGVRLLEASGSARALRRSPLAWICEGKVVSQSSFLFSSGMERYRPASHCVLHGTEMHSSGRFESGAGGADGGGAPAAGVSAGDSAAAPHPAEQAPQTEAQLSGDEFIAEPGRDHQRGGEWDRQEGKTSAGEGESGRGPGGQGATGRGQEGPEEGQTEQGEKPGRPIGSGLLMPRPVPPPIPAPSLSPSPSLLSEDSDEDIELCPAEFCLQPEGDEVDWVQCDGSCNLWFHQVCVGVSAEQAEEEDYVCATCMRQQTSRR